jgi:hypothetical protein
MQLFKITAVLSEFAPRGIAALRQAPSAGSARLVHTFAKRRHGRESSPNQQPPAAPANADQPAGNRRNVHSKARPARTPTSPATDTGSKANPQIRISGTSSFLSDGSSRGLSRTAQRAAAMAAVASSSSGLGPVATSPPAMTREGEAAMLLVQNMVVLAKQLRLPVSYKVGEENTCKGSRVCRCARGIKMDAGPHSGMESGGEPPPFVIWVSTQQPDTTQRANTRSVWASLALETYRRSIRSALF